MLSVREQASLEYFLREAEECLVSADRLEESGDHKAARQAARRAGDNYRFAADVVQRMAMFADDRNAGMCEAAALLRKGATALLRGLSRKRAAEMIRIAENWELPRPLRPVRVIRFGGDLQHAL